MKEQFPKFIQQQLRKQNTHGFFQAYAMFVDLSGFTQLTQTLMKQGNEGAERLSGILNDIFAPMVALTYNWDGFIPYYAGDAFTAIFKEGEINAIEVVEAAQKMRALVSSRKFEGFEIGVKIGLSFGEVEWGILGNETKSFYFRGEAIDGCADAQKYANEQEILLEPTIIQHLGNKINSITAQNPRYQILSKQNKSAGRVRLAKYKKQARRQNAGEFRSVISIFVSFTGVENHNELNAFVSVVLAQMHNFSGYFKEVDFSDKGGVLVGFFGAPVSFENNVERALEFTTAVRENLAEWQANSPLEFRVGITSGIAFTGIIGGKERSQYAAVGSTVNLAARLMTYANWGEVLVDKEIQENRFFRFKHHGDLNYKGFEEAVPTYKLIGRSIGNKPSYTGAMIGRDEELNELQNFAATIFREKKAGLACMYGEAGIGKSRLSFELKEQLKRGWSLNWFTCPADQMLKKSFNPFVTFLRSYFNQSSENKQHENTENFQRQFDKLRVEVQRTKSNKSIEIMRELQRTQPILAALIGLKTENDIWEKLDARGRFQNTLAALTNFFLAEANMSPLVIELEDGHWFDDNSQEFLHQFITSIKGLPIFLLVTSRYNDNGEKPYLFNQEKLNESGLKKIEFDLNMLKPKAIRAFAQARLQGKISMEFFELLKRTTNGNPFYLEQIIEYFVESELLHENDGIWHIEDQNIKLSNSINAILTARIDRLSNLVKETVKTAAVIGREFELPVLTEVLRANDIFIERNGDTVAVLKEQVQTAERGQIWRAMNELRYIFKHSLLREAVYDMQLRAQLRSLHQHIAEAIEKLYADNLEQRYVDLAFHYEQAGVAAKTHFYYKKAADYSRRNFQNKRAIYYYDKLLQVVDNEEDMVKELLRKGSVLELIGEWEACEKTYQIALNKARSLRQSVLQGRTNDSLGHLLMLKGAYDEARIYLEAAAGFFEKIDDNIGMSKVYGNLGNLYFRQGNYNDAKSYFTRSIELGQMYEQTAVQAQIVANLGLTHMNQGNYDEGIRWQQSQLEICKQTKDKQGMSILYTYMGVVYLEKGDYDAALTCFEPGLELCEELGNKQLTAIAIGCMGSVYQRKGDYAQAMQFFRRDLDLTEALGDKQGIAIALGLIGNLLNTEGKFDEAIPYLERNLALCEGLGYQKGIAKAVNALGDVFLHKKELERSLNYYNRSIEVTRSIDNKLVLGESLTEKGIVLLAMQRLEEAQKHNQEALILAEELGNPYLLFGVKLLAARIAQTKGNKEEARAILEQLLAQADSKKAKASMYYEWYLLEGNIAHKEQALRLYRELFAATPQYLFAERIKELE